MSSVPASAAPRLKMADIARMAGVSVSTVSRALAGSPLVPDTLRDQIETLAQAHGYVINQAARNLRLQTTHTIGIVLPMGHESGQKITDPFALDMIGHCAEEIIRRGYDVLLTKIVDLHDGWINGLVQSQRFDGLVVFGQSTEHKALNEAAGRYLPMVVWGERLPGQTYASVGLDNVLGGRLATEHLAAGGRRAIHFIGPLKVPEVDARYEGYRQILSEAGLFVPPPIDSCFTFESAQFAARTFLAARPQIDGLFAASDVIAHGAMTAMAEAGLKVPQDIAVCGFDDVGLARALSPPLTTVRQDLELAAHNLVEVLFRRMAGEAAGGVILPADLIVRASTGPKSGRDI